MEKKYTLVSALLSLALFISCSNNVPQSGSITMDVTMPGTSASARATDTTDSASYKVTISLLDSSGATLQTQSATASAGSTVSLAFSAISTGTKVTVAGSVYYGTELYATLSSKQVTIQDGDNVVTLTASTATPTVTIVMPASSTYTPSFSSVTKADDGTYSITATITNGTETVTPESSTLTLYTTAGESLSSAFSGYFTYDSSTQTLSKIPSWLPSGTYQLYFTAVLGGVSYNWNGTFTFSK